MNTLATALALITVCVLATSASGQEQSIWWHGTFVNSDPEQVCGSSDSQVTFEPNSVYPWEENCEITLQTDIRDIAGVLLDVACFYPDSPGEGHTDRLALFELSNGNMLEYSRLSKNATELRRCPR